MPRRARRADQHAILATALARARAAGTDGVAVFDLDSTLLDNRPRQARIFQDYGRVAKLEPLRSAGPWHFEDWDLSAALRNVGLSEGLVRMHLGRVRRFWEERFFTSDYCRHDLPVPGASDFVRAVHATGCRIAYVTGRPAAMEEGTLDVLRRFGFPLPDGETTWLFMKPGEALRDDAWKVIVRDAVDELGSVVLAFDNEPAHVNAYARAWRRALAVHLDTDDSGRPVDVDEAVPSVADLRFGDVARVSGGAEHATAQAR